jgi:tetratricopeptide (TPR) repeat protein
LKAWPRKARCSRVLPLAVLVAILTFTLYLPSLWSGFVYDAEAQILSGEYLHDPSHFPDVLTMRVLAQDLLDGNRPVQLFSLMLDALLWGKNPVGYHLTSNLLHAANSALLFVLLVTLMRSGKREFSVACALAGAFVFAAHPLLVEPVAEVSSREDLLAVFFVLTALLFALIPGAGRVQIWTTVGCLLAVLLACGAKEVGIVAPFLILLCGLLFRGEGSLRRSLWLSAGAFVVAVGFLVARFSLQPTDSEIFLHKPEYLGGSLAMTVEIQPRIWTFYLRQIFWPVLLSADYVAQNVTAISKVWGYGTLGVVVLAMAAASWKSRLAALGVAVFWLGLAPISNFVPIYRPVADRYVYLPMVGIAMIVCGLLLLVSHRAALFKALLAMVGVAVLALASLTWRRQEVFANSLNLWTDTSAKSPFSDTAANNLGYALLEKKEYQAALDAFQKAANISQGKKPKVWTGAAVTLEKLGRPRDAENALRRAIELDAIYSNPRQLVKSMLVTKDQAAVLEQILQRK